MPRCGLSVSSGSKKPIQGLNVAVPLPPLPLLRMPPGTCSCSSARRPQQLLRWGGQPLASVVGRGHLEEVVGQVHASRVALTGTDMGSGRLTAPIHRADEGLYG